MKEFKSFRLDPVNHVLLHVAEGGSTTPVAITAKAFELLRYFVDHPGRLVTHEELLEAVWPGRVVHPEVLKGHVLAIRTALKDDAKHPAYLETQRGHGYRFIAPVLGSKRNGQEETPVVPLQGREEPRAALRHAFDEALQGKTRVIFVRGEAGIGKTALVENFYREMEHRPVLMSFGRCIEGFGGVEPFYPVIEALERWVKADDGAIIQDALLSHAPAWASLLSSLMTRERRALMQRSPQISTRGRVLGEFCELLEHLAETSPVVLWIEDTHWADYSTLDLLSAVSRRQAKKPILLICTLRSDHQPERAHALKQLVDDLHLHALCTVMDLQALNVDDIARCLGADPLPESMALAASLHHLSGGNPLFLGAILDHLRSRGVLTHTEGRWTCRVSLPTLDAEIPPTINELVEARIAAVDEETRGALEAASAVGNSFNAIVPAAAAGLSAGRFEEICEQLHRSGMFVRRARQDLAARSEQVRMYAFRHALYREVLLARQGPLRLAQRHALIAEALERTYANDHPSHAPFELAGQFSDAHEWSKAISYLRMSLQTAKRRFAHRDALAILDQADHVARHVPEHAQASLQLELLEDRASIYAASHDRRAVEVFSDLALSAAELKRTDIQARAELGLGFASSWTDAAVSVRHLEAAYRLSDGQANPQLRARLRLSSAAWRIWIAGWKRELADICETNLRPLRNGDDRQIAAWGLIEHCLVCLVSSRYREALETIEENAEILVRHAVDRPEFNVFRAIWMMHLGRPWLYILLGEWGRAISEFDASEALFVTNSNRYSICTLETLRGFLYILAGDHQGVRDVCAKLGFYKDTTRDEHPALYTLMLPNEKRHCALLAGAADAGQGREEAGIELLIGLHQEMTEKPVVMDWYWQFLLLWVLADTLAKVGRVDEARLFAEKLVHWVEPTEESTWRAMAYELRARIAMRQDDLKNAAYFLERGLEITQSLGVPVVEWRIHRVASELYRLKGQDELVRRHRRALHVAVQRLLDSLPKGHRLAETFQQLVQ